MGSTWLVLIAQMTRELRGVLRTLGISCSPFNAWLILKGLETLEVRMLRVQDSAHELAHWVSGHECVRSVHYTGLSEHPQYALASHQQQQGHGGLFCFEVEGGQTAAWRWVDALSLVARCTNIGDTRSMVTHPATTTHWRLSDIERQMAGISTGMIRMSVGLEDLKELKKDMSEAFDAIKHQYGSHSEQRMHANGFP